MGVLGNIYCIPTAAASVGWATILGGLAERSIVHPPYRAGCPFESDADRTGILWPENWIAPETLHARKVQRPLRDYPTLEEAIAYVQAAPDATIMMDSPWSSFQAHPDGRALSAALALYRFTAPVPFRVGVPQDFSDVVEEFPEFASQPTEPRWQGTVSELLWLHGKCVPCEEDFLGSPLHELLRAVWPGHLLLADEFL